MLLLVFNKRFISSRLRLRLVVQGEIRRVADQPYVPGLFSIFTSTNPPLQSDFCYGFSHAVRSPDSHISVTEFRLSILFVRIFGDFLFTVIMRAHERNISAAENNINHFLNHIARELKEYVRRKKSCQKDFRERSAERFLETKTVSFYFIKFTKTFLWFLVVKDWN